MDLSTLLEELKNVSNRDYPIEPVIIEFLRKGNVRKAADLALEITPSPPFASVFAKYLLSLPEMDSQFVSIKKIAEEEITEEEADAILSRYTSPTGKRNSYRRVVPENILKASSIEAMTEFYQAVLDDKDAECARKYFVFLKAKF